VSGHGAWRTPASELAMRGVEQQTEIRDIYARKDVLEQSKVPSSVASRWLFHQLIYSSHE